MPGTLHRREGGDDVAKDAELAKKLEEVCPVSIFRASDAGVEIVERTSTSACSATSASRPRPKGSVQVVKLYES